MDHLLPHTPTPPPGPDDAAVETAEEAKEPAEADINELCRDMFSKMATYLTGELTGETPSWLIPIVLLRLATQKPERCFRSLGQWLNGRKRAPPPPSPPFPREAQDPL